MGANYYCFVGGESRNRTHAAGISGPICFQGSAITALASLHDSCWRKVSDSNAREAYASIRLATGAIGPLWQPSRGCSGWGGRIRTDVDLLQRQVPRLSATPQANLVHGD